jgi:uncharacterized cupredoxin-like copper-binding protein
MRKRLSRLGGSAAVAVVLLAFTGCSSQPPGGRSVRVTERDFHISAPASVPAGNVQLAVHNRGPDAHELIVVKAAHGSGLPLRADGTTVNEDTLDRVTAGSLEPGEPGSARNLQVHLSPGRYEMFCNMSGHYLGGMRTELAVR